MPDIFHGPWLFHRDDLTLLEEDFDALFESHELTQSKREKDMEESVLKEHLQTEERSESQLAERLGPEWIIEAFADELDDSEQEETSHSHLHVEHAQIDPLYAEVIRWTKATVRWGRRQYFKKGNRSEDVYRILVNAHLVPMKISFALSEEHDAEKLSREIAAKEYELAAIYLERTLGSLRSLALRLEFGEELLQAIRRAQIIQREIHVRRKGLQEPPAFGL